MRKLLGARGAPLLSLALVALLTLSGAAAASTPACDDSLQAAFAPAAQTQVLATHAFAAGEPLALGTPAPGTPTAEAGVCMVKLLVGPGAPGPAGAPSTSAGIGIEVWLPQPAAWNERIDVKGGSGWVGGVQTSLTQLAGAGTPAWNMPAYAAMRDGSVSANSDAGHPEPYWGSFAMRPDGSLNTVLLRDFADRAVHEMAVATKTLARAYYGRPARHAYLDGFSTGGMEGLSEAQRHAGDFDGILAGAPAINWTRFLVGDLYPQVVVQRDLGGQPLTQAQREQVTWAAIAACDVVGDVHLGYIPDPFRCRYDPTGDPHVLCPSAGGLDDGPGCLSRAQALAVDKIWYGQTADGSVPPTGADEGGSIRLAPDQLWYGLARGTSLYVDALHIGLAGPSPFWVASDTTALALQDASIATPRFAGGQDRWRELSYADLAHASAQGVALQAQLGDINTDDPDLSAFRAAGGKLLAYHGLADELIPTRGTIDYYQRVARAMGGVRQTQSFFRLYLVPGMGHLPSLDGHGDYSAGTPDRAVPPPLPSHAQLMDALVAWVEHGEAPGRIDVASPVTPAKPISTSRPLCPYPRQATYRAGDPQTAAAYDCRGARKALPAVR